MFTTEGNRITTLSDPTISSFYSHHVGHLVRSVTLPHFFPEHENVFSACLWVCSCHWRDGMAQRRRKLSELQKIRGGWDDLSMHVLLQGDISHVFCSIPDVCAFHTSFIIPHLDMWKAHDDHKPHTPHEKLAAERSPAKVYVTQVQGVLSAFM